MQERTVKISNRLGLHARAAARLGQCAAMFSSNIEIERQDSQQTADGKSILSVLLLAASAGTTLTIKIDGADEERAADAIVELIEGKFGEGVSDGLY